MGPGGDDGNSEAADDLFELGECVGETDAGAGEEDGTLGVVDATESVGDLCGDGGGVPQELVFGWVVVFESGLVDLGGLDVDGDVDPAGAGAAVLREVPGAFEVIGDGGGIVDPDGVLGDAFDHADDVDFLVA